VLRLLIRNQGYASATTPAASQPSTTEQFEFRAERIPGDLYGEAAKTAITRAAKVGVLQQYSPDVILGACVKAAIDSGTCFLKPSRPMAPFLRAGLSEADVRESVQAAFRSADHEAYRPELMSAKQH